MKFRQLIFKYRSYTPIPFIVLILVFAAPNIQNFIIGLCTVICGEAVRFWGVAIAGSETRTTDQLAGKVLITSGPFAYVRNPLYIGNTMMYIGFAIMANAFSLWLPSVVFLFFLIQYSIIVSFEEEYLKEKFGEQYMRYCREVPRFFPRMSKRVSVEVPQPQFNFIVALKSESRTLQAFVILTAAIVIRWQLRG